MNAKVIFHANCPDGFTAAWLIREWLVNIVLDHYDVELIPASYGDLPPKVDADSDVYIVDFCYETAALHAIANRLAGGAGQLVILDHHETSRQWMIDTFGDHLITSIAEPVDRSLGVVAVSDMEHSGAGLAAWYSGVHRPLVDYVQDRDLWRFALKGTAEVFAAVTARPYTIEAYDQLAALSVQELIEQGHGIAMYRQRLIEQTVETAFQERVLGHDDIWIAASPYAIGSDVAGELAKRDPDRFAGYFVHYGDRVRFGLRSTADGLNVAEIAAEVGGGGHAHAAGFEVATWSEVTS